jgi:universal stress protein A
LSERYDAKLQVLHIVEPMVFYYDDYDPIVAGMPLNDETQLIQAEDSMKKFAGRLQFGKDVRLEVQWGTPKWSIVSWAREKDIDLIVVGSHGRHGIVRLLGSVSSGVLNQAHCDVLVVKP